MLQETFDIRRLITSIALLSVFLGTTAIRFYPDWFDRPVAKALNNFALGHRFATDMAHGIAYPTLQGMIVVSLLWYCWFSGPGSNVRTRLVVGAGAAVIAGFIAHLLRYTISPTFRPIFDPSLQLHSPGLLGDIDALRENFNWPAFPSERATMFAGLAMAIVFGRRDVGLLALACTTAVEFSRIYLGLHYLTDIIGSFSLAAAVLWFSQMPWCSELGRPFIRWERASPSTFYLCAFIASFQLTTAFADLRALARSFFA